MKKTDNKQKKPQALTPEAVNRLKKLILLFSVGACAVRLLLGVIHEILLSNLTPSSIFVSLSGYINEAFSVCALFALMAVAVYASLAGRAQLTIYAALMQGISMLMISTLANCLVIWLLTLLGDSSLMRGAPFEISNYTTGTLNSTQIIYLLTISFVSAAVIMLIIVVFLLILRAMTKKQRESGADLSVSGLADAKRANSPLIRICMIFPAVFVGVSLVSRIIDTVNLITGGEPPRTVGDYIVLATPYFMLVIFTAAGVIAMQVTAERTARRIKEICTSSSER